MDQGLGSQRAGGHQIQPRAGKQQGGVAAGLGRAQGGDQGLPSLQPPRGLADAKGLQELGSHLELAATKGLAATRAGDHQAKKA